MVWAMSSLDSNVWSSSSVGTCAHCGYTQTHMTGMSRWAGEDEGGWEHGTDVVVSGQGAVLCLRRFGY
jgi:hypothetical protein